MYWLLMLTSLCHWPPTTGMQGAVVVKHVSNVNTMETEAGRIQCQPRLHKEILLKGGQGTVAETPDTAA